MFNNIASTNVAAAQKALVDGLREKIKNFKESQSYQTADVESKKAADETLEKIEALATTLENYFNAFDVCAATYTQFNDASYLGKAALATTILANVKALRASLVNLRGAMSGLVYPKNPNPNPLAKSLQNEIDNVIGSQFKEGASLFSLMVPLPIKDLEAIMKAAGAKMQTSLASCGLATLDISSFTSFQNDLKFYFEIMFRQMLSPEMRAQQPANDWGVNNPDEKFVAMGLNYPDGQKPSIEDANEILRPSPVQTTASVETTALKPDRPQWSKTEELVTLYEIAFALQSKIKTLAINSPERASYETLYNQVLKLDNELVVARHNTKGAYIEDLHNIQVQTVILILNHTDITISDVNRQHRDQPDVTVEAAVGNYRTKISGPLKALPVSIARRIAAVLAGFIGTMNRCFSKKEVSQAKESATPAAQTPLKTGGGLILHQSKLTAYSKAPAARIADTVEHIAKMKP